MKKPVSRIKLLIFSVIPLFFLLFLGEVSMRLWAFHLRTPYERYNYSAGRFELIPTNHHISPNGDDFRINSRGFVGPEFQNPKPDHIYRAFALGDSCTFGSGHWKNTYPAMLQDLLNSADLGRRFEVINAGIEGYDSEQALSRLKNELLQYEPDMIIIYIGWNDLMKVNPKNISVTGKYTWLRRLMHRSYLLKAYNKLVFYYLRPLFMRPKLAGGEADIHAFDEFIPLTFQQNLKAMIVKLQERGIMPVLITLPTVVERHMTYNDINRQRVFFPYYAGTYSVDRFLSLHKAYNDVVRRTAFTVDVPLVDLNEIFNMYNKTSLFWDTMHPNKRGHRLVARSVFERVKDVFKEMERKDAPRGITRVQRRAL
jgi:lysophospholipase L1-like esterase